MIIEIFFIKLINGNQKGIKVIIVCWVPARTYVFTNFYAILGRTNIYMSFIIFMAKKSIHKLCSTGVQSHIMFLHNS